MSNLMKGGTSLMDYKAVIEEQINTLQKLEPKTIEDAISIASMVSSLCYAHKQLKEEGPEETSPYTTEEIKRMQHVAKDPAWDLTSPK